MEFIFSDNTVVDNVDSIPADFRGLYQVGEGEQEGKQVLRSDDAVKSAVAAITGLQTSLKASRAEAKANKGVKVDLTPLADYGETPDGIKSSFEQKLNEAAAAAKKDGDTALEARIEKIKEDLGKGFEKEREGFTNRNTALLGQLEQVMFRHAALAAAEAAGVTDPELFLTMLAPSIKTGEVDGTFIVQVVDEAGDIRYSGVTGKPMTTVERIQEMKGQERFGPFFKSESKTGSGTTPGAMNRAAPKVSGEMSSVEKIAIGLKAGQAKRT